jgi:hypothetical protein
MIQLGLFLKLLTRQFSRCLTDVDCLWLQEVFHIVELQYFVEIAFWLEVDRQKSEGDKAAMSILIQNLVIKVSLQSVEMVSWNARNLLSFNCGT